MHRSLHVSGLYMAVYGCFNRIQNSASQLPGASTADIHHHMFYTVCNVNVQTQLATLPVLKREVPISQPQIRHYGFKLGRPFRQPLSPIHTGSYDFVIVRLVAIWSATTDRQCLLRSPFTIARSGVFFTIGCRSYVTSHDNLLFIPSGQL